MFGWIIPDWRAARDLFHGHLRQYLIILSRLKLSNRMGSPRLVECNDARTQMHAHLMKSQFRAQRIEKPH